MEDIWIKKWNERYGEEDYAYGETPNVFFEEKIKELKTGKILLPAEGEGRNAVFAAKLGWSVFAFDQSEEGKKKAMKLAKKNGVTIDYQVGDLGAVNFPQEEFDVIGLIYAHFPANLKSAYHKILDGYLKKGGFVVFEAFSKNNLTYRAKNEKIGGPRDLDSLFSIEEIKADFSNYEILQLEEKEVELGEGLYHNGKGSVIRFVGKKK
ncbi:class I SAM-dependent methyltransferase [Cyclobacterium sp. 1_MG-2023]|uniref:class I SAM-dependent methyltransferase n=1 Tax=Cyclobacterium sp. 1_MG-2023 TaxID=3062681 RepID=UPI0026E17A07|nr:class I SAM-dependent methyltransferase [Cyclobacterium sp. 1_MG-2023]MDO6439071.1 class I SAM-dependent methyltransferase [Cyclobacterium sp. 1_MG-2023]